MEDMLEEYSDIAGAWHLVNYIPGTQKTLGTMSYNVMRFKKNYQPFVDKWTIFAVNEMSKLNIQFDIIVRVLAHDELEASGGKGLDKMGEALATKLNSIYKPSILTKSKCTRKMSSLNSQERKSEINGVYNVDNKLHDLSGRNILILDDILTTGYTVKEIIRALNESFPENKPNCYLFCLARTDYVATENDTIHLDYFTN